MKKIKTQDAIGHVLCHDITQIVKGVSCGRKFKKGHVVKAEDIDVLLSLGKDHLFVFEADENMVHENDAAQQLYDICKNEHMKPTEVKEGKIEIIATKRGLLKVDVDRLEDVNALGEMIIATRHNNTVVNPNDKLAGTRIIPLLIEKEKLAPLETIHNNKPLLEIKPFHHFKVGVITTGNEVYHGRIKDTFTPVIAKKLADYNLEINRHHVVSDDVDQIKAAIADCRDNGIEFIICTGGMSVDPDDLTPSAIKQSGANILTYGAPVLPGAMLLIGYFEDNMPIVGLPGCVMYADATSLDLMLPRILAKDEITKREIAKLGHGGLCLKCPVCTFPHCEFGKGS